MALHLLDEGGAGAPLLISRIYLENGPQGSGMEASAAVDQVVATEEFSASPLTRGCPRSGVQQILLVEDEAFVRRVTAEVLESAGYGVPVASNAAEALEVCHRGLEPVDLLLSDVVLPGRNGRDLADEFSVLYPGIRVLLISGYAEQLALSTSAGEGHEWLAKPFSTDALLSKVRQLLQGGAGEVRTRLKPACGSA